ncbi:hypothetical protein JNB62_17905 [Microbacterium jejuense]|uniref:Ig-like domain-containing protein n=1 Tax=Microbacterium jejuense TaxID=1263637 RepID=A0ABS7HRF8_9MICO|nr:hypothetical protein [Microbacterium jejuense]MBW9095556.1 hypothetical protein [Microbacterium jejuense]
MPRRAVAALLALVGVLGVALLQPSPTEAAWVRTDVAGDTTLSAGTVAPVTQMTCTAGLLQPVTFSWTAPTGGLTRTGYRWTVTGGLNNNGGDLPATATSISLNTGLLGLGSGTFSLYVLGPGGWRSGAKTGSLSFATVVLDVLSTCSVP